MVLISQKCYEILDVHPNTDQETVREAYIALVKKVHPDSGHKEASATRFQEVDNAFRILQTKFAKERRNIATGEEDISPAEGAKVFDIKVCLLFTIL